MPESVAAVIALGPEPGDDLRPQRSLRRRLAPAGHHARLPLALDGEIVGYACTRAHHSDVGGMRARLDAGGLDLDLAGGPGHPARAARHEDILQTCILLANVRTPEIRRGDLAAQIAANRLGGRAARRAARPARARHGARRLRRGDRLRRTTRARGDRAPSRRPLRGRARGRRRRRQRGRPADPRRRHGRRRPDRDRLRRARLRRPPANVNARSRSRARPASSLSRSRSAPTSRSTRALRGRRRSARPRAAWSTRARLPRSSPGTSRPASGSPTPSCSRSRRRRTSRPQGQGTMNNVAIGSSRLDVLRDARRRPGRVSRAATGPPASMSACRTR